MLGEGYSGWNEAVQLARGLEKQEDCLLIRLKPGSVVWLLLLLLLLLRFCWLVRQALVVFVGWPGLARCTAGEQAEFLSLLLTK